MKTKLFIVSSGISIALLAVELLNVAQAQVYGNGNTGQASQHISIIARDYNTCMQYYAAAMEPTIEGHLNMSAFFTFAGYIRNSDKTRASNNARPSPSAISIIPIEELCGR